jgi:hypothetical protein
MRSPYEFLGQFWMSEEDLRIYAGSSVANTDNFPLVEYSRVINIGPVPEVMDYLINHKINYESVIFNFGKYKDRETELKLVEDYSVMEKYRMQSIVNVTRAYMKNVLK